MSNWSAYEMALIRMIDMPGLVCTVKMDGGFVFEYKGLKYDGSFLCAPEAFEAAYMYFKIQDEARELVKKAKVTIE